MNKLTIINTQAALRKYWENLHIVEQFFIIYINIKLKYVCIYICLISH